jgi:chromosome segregation ATPase
MAAGPTKGFATSTAQTLSDEQRRQLCARAVEEVKAARELIDALERRLATAREQLQAEEEKNAIEAEQKRLLEREIALLVEQKKNAAEQLANAERAVAVLTEDNQRVRAERDRANKRNLTWAAIGAGVGAVLTYLFTRDDGPIVVVP